MAHRRSRPLGGAVRTCIDWKRVKTDRGIELRCAAYTPDPGCPREAGHRKGFAYCPVGEGKRIGLRFRSGRHYDLLPVGPR